MTRTDEQLTDAINEELVRVGAQSEHAQHGDLCAYVRTEADGQQIVYLDDSYSDPQHGPATVILEAIQQRPDKPEDYGPSDYSDLWYSTLLDHTTETPSRSDLWGAVLGTRRPEDVLDEVAGPGQDLEEWMGESVEEARRQGLRHPEDTDTISEWLCEEVRQGFVAG